MEDPAIARTASNAAPSAPATAPSDPVDSDTSALRASLDLRIAFGRLRRRMREAASGDELNPAQVSVLARLAHKEASTASGLAALEGVRPQSMAMTVAALEKLGLVTRTADPTDGRRQLLELTPTGSFRDEGLRRERFEWLTRAMQQELTDAERRTIIEAAALIERMLLS